MHSPSISVSAPDLSFFGIPLDSYAAKYLFSLSLLVLLALAAKNLVRGAIGREWMAIRDMDVAAAVRSEEHTSELQSLMRISYAVFCLQKQKTNKIINISTH